MYNRHLRSSTLSYACMPHQVDLIFFNFNYIYFTLILKLLIRVDCSQLGFSICLVLSISLFKVVVRLNCFKQRCAHNINIEALIEFEYKTCCPLIQSYTMLRSLITMGLCPR